MITIREASINDISIIQDIAYKTWPETYGKILSEQQLKYMLDKFYSEEYLKQNFINNHLFFIIEENNCPLGFLGIEHNYNNELATKIHKIYILPNNQGKGIGHFSINFVANLAKEKFFGKVILNVNKFNKALNFYQKMGFQIIEVVNIEIGNGYLMEDFVMEKQII